MPSEVSKTLAENSVEAGLHNSISCVQFFIEFNETNGKVNGKYWEITLLFKKHL